MQGKENAVDFRKFGGKENAEDFRIFGVKRMRKMSGYSG